MYFELSLHHYVQIIKIYQKILLLASINKIIYQHVYTSIFTKSQEKRKKNHRIIEKTKPNPKLKMLKLSRDPILCTTTTLILITFSLFFYETEARLHHHTDKDNPNPKPEPPSQPPSSSPKANDPSSKSPSLPQDLDHEVVYNVKKYGAVGDGVTDDTESFKTAWDSACGNYKNNTASVLLVPYGFTFMIGSTIFTGPCRSYQYFQVPIIISNLFNFYMKIIKFLDNWV